MAKTKKPKKVKKSFADKVIGLPLVIFIGVLIIGLFGFKQYEYVEDEKKLNSLETLLKSYANNIESEPGSLNNSEIKNFCNYESEKYKKGRLYCGSSLGLSRRVLNVNEAKEYGAKAEDALRKLNNINITSKDEFPERPGFWQKTIYFNSAFIDRGCHLRANYRGEDLAQMIDQNDSIGSPGVGQFSLLVRCTNFASREYYPIGY